jgi:hypothetical protein
MRNELSHIEAIENYLNGKMSQSDRADFEMKMNADVSFREDVELQKSITDRIQFLAFKAEAISLHASLVSSQKSWWKKNLFLNSVLVLIGCLIATYTITIFLDKPIPKTNFVIEASPDPIVEESFLVNEETEHDSVQNTNELVVSTMKNSKSEKKKKPHLAFQKPFEKSILNATIGGTIITKDSKSSIHFAPNSLVDQNGKIVEGDVEIRYREYRNAAEMAFSGIPMMYEENGNEYRFNSAGMIEVRAYQNELPLNVKPGADFTIDYNVTQQVDSCFFFALDDEKQKWEKNERIDFDSINRANSKATEVRFEDKDRMGLKYRGILQGRVDLVLMRMNGEDRLPSVTINLYYPKNYYQGGQPTYQKRIEGVVKVVPAESADSTVVSKMEKYTGNAYQIENIDSGRYVAEIRCDGCDDVVVDTLVIYGDKVSQLDASLSLFLDGDVKSPRRIWNFGRRKREMNERWKPSTYLLTDSIMAVDRWKNSARKIESDSLNSVRSGLMNGAKSMLVQGLECQNFGVYNCDQIKRVNDRINVRPKFVDGKGIAILGIYLLSMIDLNINAAFSFSPFDFKCERGGKTVVLAFTMDKFYAISADDFAALNINSSGSYTLKMQDITDQIKTTDDLKNYLGI